MNAKNRPWRLGLSIVSAGLLTLSHAPWSIPGLGVVALVPLMVAFSDCSARERFLYGWLCGTLWSLFFVGIWLGPATLGALDIGVVGAAAVALLATQIFGGFHLALFGLVLSRRKRGPLAIAALWVGIEALRSPAFGGIPWGLLGHTVSAQPVWIQLASVAGVAGVSFWLAAVNAAFADIVIAGRFRPARVVPVMSLVAATFLFGSWRLSGGPVASAMDVQVVSSDWRTLGPDDSQPLLDRLVEETLAVRIDAELAVWPEGSARFLPTAAPSLAHQIFELAAARDLDLVFGGPRLERGMLYNAVYRVSARPGDVVATRDKRRLVPMAEAPWSGLPAGVTGFSSGHVAEPLPILAGARQLGVLVCYEALFPDLAVGLEVDVLVNPTNDVRVGYGAEQQAAMAVFRAVENGIPLLRVANVGPTLAVDAFGRVTHRMRGWRSEVWPIGSRGPTPPFAAISAWLPRRFAGDGPLSLMCLGYALYVGLGRSWRSK